MFNIPHKTWTAASYSADPHKVLVVDDNEDAAASLAILLRMAGFKVRTAFNAAAAIHIAREFKPDVCILDISMPGMNGYELAKRIRAMAKISPPILATLTAYADFEHLDRAADAGFDLHFTKPADVGDLVHQLSDSLAR